MAVIRTPMLMGPPSCQQEVSIMQSFNCKRKLLSPFIVVKTNYCYPLQYSVRCLPIGLELYQLGVNNWAKIIHHGHTVQHHSLAKIQLGISCYDKKFYEFVPAVNKSSSVSVQSASAGSMFTFSSPVSSLFCVTSLSSVTRVKSNAGTFSLVFKYSL